MVRHRRRRYLLPTGASLIAGPILASPRPHTLSWAGGRTMSEDKAKLPRTLDEFARFDFDKYLAAGGKLRDLKIYSGRQLRGMLYQLPPDTIPEGLVERIGHMSRFLARCAERGVLDLKMSDSFTESQLRKMWKQTRHE
jgi:hypothetical protein